MRYDVGSGLPHAISNKITVLRIGGGGEILLAIMKHYRAKPSVLTKRMHTLVLLQTEASTSLTLPQFIGASWMHQT